MGDLVYSSDGGDRRRELARGRARDEGGRATKAGTGDGRVRVCRETAGRKGKGVTTVSGLPGDEADLRAIAKRLKQRCGVGGSAKDGVIELQGDQRDAVVELLRAEGHTVVLAGG